MEGKTRESRRCKGDLIMKYFAYGSNMDSQRMKDREVNFSKRELAILKNYELCFNKQASSNPNEGYANLILKEGTATEGILYEIDESDIEKLDKWEASPNHYIKKTVKVKLPRGSEVDALVYIAQPDKIKDGLKPTTKYLNHLKEGRDLISKRYYNFIKSFDTLEASKQSDVKNKRG